MSTRVLLVEDEAIIATMTQEMLEVLGFDVVSSAATLDQGLQRAEADAFDVAVLDVDLRGLESFPIADALAQRGIPYIFATGFALRATQARFPSAIVIRKPFELDVLDSGIKDALHAARHA